MLSRHFYREKVLQSLYAYFVANNGEIQEFEKGVQKAIDRLHDLYIYQLSIISETVDVVEQKIEDAQQKHFPTQKEINDDTRFIQNKVIQFFSTNVDLKKKCEYLKINWAEEKEIFKTIYNQFKEQSAFEEYIALEKPTFEEDRKIASKFFKAAVNYPALFDKFVEKNLYWEDDFYQIAQLSYNTIRSIDESLDESIILSGFFDKSSDKVNDDKQFAVELFRKTVLNEDKLTDLIRKRIANWEYERIAMIDIILVKMAIAELMNFPSIPVKVTINEYIELSKEYSTEKSKTFVNAILDKIVIDLKEEGVLKKAGRGLLTD